MTTSAVKTIQAVLDNAAKGELESALQIVKMGTMLTPIEETITLAAESATFSLVDDSAAGLAAQQVIYLRITDVGIGGGTLGPYTVHDAGATPVVHDGANIPGVATIDAAGDVITFNDTALEILVKWLPVPNVATSDFFTPPTPR
jgi:hypothetical protein